MRLDDLDRHFARGLFRRVMPPEKQFPESRSVICACNIPPLLPLSFIVGRCMYKDQINLEKEKFALQEKIACFRIPSSVYNDENKFISR